MNASLTRFLALSAAAATAISLQSLAVDPVDGGKLVTDDTRNTMKTPGDPSGTGGAKPGARLEDTKRFVGDFGNTHKGPRDPADIATHSDYGGGGIGNGCEADVTRDMVVDWDDVCLVLKCWGDAYKEAPDADGEFGTTPPRIELMGDADRNGYVDFEDLLAVLAEWGACR